MLAVNIIWFYFVAYSCKHIKLKNYLYVIYVYLGKVCYSPTVIC